ncbi:MAG: HdeD family acid-resistance protein [Terrimicrobiaceae bacterium]
MTPSHDGGSRSRVWFIAGGILSLLVGVFAVSAPGIFSFFLTQLIGALCLATGLVAIFQALFGKSSPHRFLSSLSAVLRIAAGSALLFFPLAGMAALTLIVAAIFLTEGIVCLVTSFRMRANPAWVWLLLNGVVALLLGGMIYAKWPLDSAGILGILYGIQSLFSGSAMLMMGLSSVSAEKT